jgi:hypothetical protein
MGQNRRKGACRPQGTCARACALRPGQRVRAVAQRAQRLGAARRRARQGLMHLRGGRQRERQCASGSARVQWGRQHSLPSSTPFSRSPRPSLPVPSWTFHRLLCAPNAAPRRRMSCRTDPPDPLPSRPTIAACTACFTSPAPGPGRNGQSLWRFGPPATPDSPLAVRALRLWQRARAAQRYPRPGSAAARRTGQYRRTAASEFGAGSNARDPDADPSFLRSLGIRAF